MLIVFKQNGYEYTISQADLMSPCFVSRRKIYSHFNDALGINVETGLGPKEMAPTLWAEWLFENEENRG